MKKNILYKTFLIVILITISLILGYFKKTLGETEAVSLLVLTISIFFYLFQKENLDYFFKSLRRKATYNYFKKGE